MKHGQLTVKCFLNMRGKAAPEGEGREGGIADDELSQSWKDSTAA